MFFSFFARSPEHHVDTLPDLVQVIPSAGSLAPSYDLCWSPFISRHNAKMASGLPKRPVKKVLRLYPLIFTLVYKRFF